MVGHDEQYAAGPQVFACRSERRVHLIGVEDVVGRIMDQHRIKIPAQIRLEHIRDLVVAHRVASSRHVDHLRRDVDALDG